MLKEEQEEIENLIAVAEQMKLVGIRKGSILGYYAGMDFRTLAENTERFRNSEYFKMLTQKFEASPMEYAESCEQIMDKICYLKEEDLGNGKAEEVAKCLVQTNMKHFGMGGIIIVFSLAISFQGGGEISRSLGDAIDENTMKIAGDSIIKYFLNTLDVLQDEFVQIIVKYYSVIGDEYAKPEVKKMVGELKELLRKYFGVASKEDYEFLFEFFPVQPYKGKGDYLGYALNAIKYYSIS